MAKTTKKSNAELMRERMKAKAEREKRTGANTILSLPSGVEFYKPVKGRNRLDVIPYMSGTHNYVDQFEKGTQTCCQTIYVHRGVGVSGDDGRGNKYICLQKTFGKKCPICEYITRQKTSGVPYDEWKTLVPQQVELYNVIDLNDPEKNIKVLYLPFNCFGKQLRAEIEERENEDGDSSFWGFGSLEEGYTIVVRFDEKKFKGQSYFEAGKIDLVERKPYKESIMEKATDFGMCLKALSYNELESVFLAEPVGSEDNDDEEEDKPIPPPKKKRKPEPDPEPDEEEEEDEDNDVDDDEPIPPPKKKRKPEPEPDEDEEEEEDEEEGDEPAPPPKKKRKPEPEPEPDEEDEEEEDEPIPPPKKKRKPEPEPDDDDDDNECPIKGSIFGQHCDAHDECTDCDLWESCKDKQELLEEKKKEKKTTKRK